MLLFWVQSLLVGLCIASFLVIMGNMHIEHMAPWQHSVLEFVESEIGIPATDTAPPAGQAVDCVVALL